MEEPQPTPPDFPTTPGSGAPYGAILTARKPPKQRWWLHAGLLAMTAYTMTVAGSFNEGALDLDRVGSLRGLLRAIVDPHVLAAGVPFAICLLAILFSHEMGHYLACRHYGIPASLPFFLPGPTLFGTFGAVIRIRGVIPNRRALFDVAAAGPLAGAAVAIPVLVWGLRSATPVIGPLPPGTPTLGSPVLSMILERAMYGQAELRVGSIYLAGWFGMLVTSLNLLPVGQLDGGHAVYSVSRGAHRRASRLTILGAIALVILQWLLYGSFSPYTVWCVVLLLMWDRHPRLVDEWTPLDPSRRLVALALLVLFAFSFIPFPFSF